MKKLLVLLILLSFNAFGGQKMLHPDFPVVKGKYQMTPEWSLTLGQEHNRRVDEGSLVLWRPDFTVWINIWGNDNNESIEERLKWITAESSPNAFDVNSVTKGSAHAFLYRLNETGNGKVTFSYNGYILANDSHVQVSVYFDSESEVSEAKSIIESIEYAQP
jgi:hypothetical protein